jgi:uncharacterized protein YjbI with pentapeptide repeats
MPTEDKLWLPPLSPKDQQKLDRLRSKGKKSTSNWTGFAGRTLWDWLQFFAVLAIPVIVAAGTLYFTQQITQQQVQLSIAANERQHQTDMQIAQNQQNQATLQSFLDRISDLLLNHNLRGSKPEDEIRNVVRTETFSTLSQLDGNRKGILIQFLYQEGLISTPSTTSDRNNPIIPLDGADLRNISMSGTGVAIISQKHGSLNAFICNQSHTVLLIKLKQQPMMKGIDLSGIDLKGADLSNSNIRCVYLNNADLENVNLTDTEMFGDNLNNADLSDADLKGTRISNLQLDQVKSLGGARMPDGSIHP